MKQSRPCNEEQLVLYHYNELSTDNRRELDHHLQTCGSCRSALVEIGSSLAALPRPELQLSPAQKRVFVERVNERVRRSPTYLRAAWGGVLATAVLVAGVMLMRPADLPLTVAPHEPAMADFEMLQQLDLLRELDLLKELDLLQEMGQLG